MSPKHPNTRRQPPGFSLLEMMVVLALMAVLLQILNPALAGHLNHQQQFFAMQQLYRDLQFARGLAIANKTAVTVCPTDARQRCQKTNRWDQGWMVFFDPQRRGQPSGVDDIIKLSPSPMPGSITSGGRTRFRFSPEGGAYGNNGTLTQCATSEPGPMQSVVVSNPGRIRFVRSHTLGVC